VRLRNLALPLIGASGGLLAAGAFCIVGLCLWSLLEAPSESALAVAAWGLACGALVGCLLGVWRAVDLWWSEASAKSAPSPRETRTDPGPHDGGLPRDR
jgi:hypothetical protein